MKDFFLFFPILIIVWLGYGVKYIYETASEKCVSVLGSNSGKTRK